MGGTATGGTSSGGAVGSGCSTSGCSAVSCVASGTVTGGSSGVPTTKTSTVDTPVVPATSVASALMWYRPGARPAVETPHDANEVPQPPQFAARCVSRPASSTKTTVTPAT